MRTRREFLSGCSAAVAWCALLPESMGGTAGSSAGGFTSLAHISYAALASQVNTLFQVRLSPERTVELRLIQAPLAPAHSVTTEHGLPPDARNERFSLIFNGLPETVLDSGIHCFEHTHIGLFEMYIGGVGSSDASRVRYEAVFNRPSPVASLFMGAK